MKKYEFSLLWPNNVNNKSFIKLPESTVQDLNLLGIVDNISKNRKLKPMFLNYLTNLPLDINIIKHRQESFNDLLENEELINTLNEVKMYLSSLHYYNGRVKKEENRFYEMVFRISELSKLIEVIEKLNMMFLNLKKNLNSDGFKNLRQYVFNFIQKDEYLKLKKILPNMLKSLNNIKSVSLGINLDTSLLPTSATIEKINNFTFKPKDNSFLKQLFSNNKTGLTSFNTLDKKDSIYDLLSPQLQGLTYLLEKSSDPVIKRVKEFRDTNSQGLINLKNELDFLLVAVDLFLDLRQRGIQLIKPIILDASKRVIKLENSLNLDLVLQGSGSVTGNSVDLNSKNSFALISGPNSGGKTVYLQSIGLNQILAQSGLPVLAEYGEISIIDNIFTHYQINEDSSEDQGRFGVEVKRLKNILESVTNRSLLLFNETFSSTSVSEAITIAEDILKYISTIGIRGAYTTHISLLTSKVDILNQRVQSESKIFNLIASINNKRERTFKIIPGSPCGYSYGRELAIEMGVSFKQLMIKNYSNC